ncbi:MAG: xanthine dehydrogenase family protein molybdopterin-binding subunit, partial [Acidimicrobiales bacterium]
MREALAGRLVGTRVRRVEDRRLLTGEGRYIDDFDATGLAHAAFLRSPHPHASIRAISTTAAEHLSGVFCVLTGADMQRLSNPFIGMLALDGLYDPIFYALATDRVRHVGDPVAIVVASSRRVAEDACELIDVDYEPIQSIATMAHSLDPSRPAIWPKAGGNVMWRSTDTYGEVDAAFASADRVIRERFTQHRQSNQPMETRGSVAEVDPISGDLTFHSCTQSTHMLKWALALMLGRRPVWRSLKQIATNREVPAKVFKAARAYLKANPELLDVSKRMQPAMLKQIRQDPKRVVHLTEAMLGLLAKQPRDLPRVLARDIGGAFGAKTLLHREDVALAVAAMHLGRSVKWIEDRNEHLTVGGQAREETLDISAAVQNDGTVLALRVAMTLDMGAYPGFPY